MHIPVKKLDSGHSIPSQTDSLLPSRGSKSPSGQVFSAPTPKEPAPRGHHPAPARRASSLLQQGRLPSRARRLANEFLARHEESSGMLIVCWRISKRFGEIYTDFHVTATESGSNPSSAMWGRREEATLMLRVMGSAKRRQRQGDRARLVPRLPGCFWQQMSSEDKERRSWDGDVELSTGHGQPRGRCPPAVPVPQPGRAAAALGVLPSRIRCRTPGHCGGWKERRKIKMCG